jgi:hypothetical protein
MPFISEIEYQELLNLRKRKEKYDKKWREHQSTTKYKARKSETNRDYYLNVTKPKKAGRRIV